MNSLKKIKLRYWLIGSILLGTILLMLAIRAQFVDVPLRVAPETTYVTSPLKAHGSHDFTGLSSNHYGIILALAMEAFNASIRYREALSMNKCYPFSAPPAANLHLIRDSVAGRVEGNLVCCD